MRKRIIKVVAFYDLENKKYNNTQIAPKETIKKLVEKDMIIYFGMNEGYKGIEVEVIDE